MQLLSLKGNTVVREVLSKEEVMDVARRFAKDANEIFPTATVILFGSYAKGWARPGSDIDIALLFVEFPYENVRKQFEEEIKLERLIFEKYKMDIQFVTRTLDDSTGFVHNILDTGILISDPCNQVIEISDN